jgi:3-hydroxyacyl-CoA dehydrogenase
MTKRRIKHVSVLGSGVMGAGIACHLANAGMEVLMLDIVPPAGTNGGNKTSKNKIADDALNNAVKSKPAALYDSSFVSRIKTGNFEDDFAKISQSDWIIEVVIERLDIKQNIFEKVDKYRKPGSLVTSNTSGIPIHMLAEGRSSDFAGNFCGTHFFNPPRYMALFEVIPHKGTDPDVINFWMAFGQDFLGKKSVLCKDTPAFIANRIGFYSGNKVGELTYQYDLSIEEVDKLTGDTIGWPNTGSYRLLDLVGFDTSIKVTKGVIDNCPEDEYVIKIKNNPQPKATSFLLENNYLGDKSGQGFYKKTNERDESGNRIILALDLKTLEYKPAIKPRLEAVGIAKKVEMMPKRLLDIFENQDKSCRFIKDLLCGIMAYAANRIPEISDNIYSIDDAMKSGYAWGYGAFEYWDMIGFEKGIDFIDSCGEKLPDWINKMKSSGFSSFYKIEEGCRWYYDINSNQYEKIPGSATQFHLDNVRHKTPVYKNSECILHDMGEDVLCFEFITKSNAIGEGIGTGMAEALHIAENGNWRGIVIGNNAKNFTVGANLMAVGMLAMQKEFGKLEEMVHGFQQINMAMRYSKIPVVTATQGYVFGGGVEMLMHTDAAVCHAESYIGLVEVGVGLIPGGGGTKEFALRASDSFFEGDVQIPTLIEKLKVIATATVATSAYEGYKHGYLQTGRDTVEINLNKVLSTAKEKVISLSERYVAPSPKEAMVLGRNALGTLYTAINEFYKGNYMSEYDVEISRKVAYVLCGGDLTSPQKVSEQYLLDIEKEAFLQLLGNQKTLDRIQYLLMNNKPLRN